MRMTCFLEDIFYFEQNLRNLSCHPNRIDNFFVICTEKRVKITNRNSNNINRS